MDLPLPRGADPGVPHGRVGEPSPGIGPLVCAASDFDARGISLDPWSRGMGLPGKVALGAFVGPVFGGGAYLGIGLLLAALVPYSVFEALPLWLIAGLPALAVAAAAVWFFALRLTRARREGLCAYVGRSGFEVFALSEAGTRRLWLVDYLAAPAMLERLEKLIRGSYLAFREDLLFLDDRGQLLGTLGGHTPDGDRPDALTFARREAAGLALDARLARARAALRQGQAVAFPTFTPSGGRLVPGPLRLWLTASELRIDGPGAPRPGSIPPNGLSLWTGEGRFALFAPGATAPTLELDCAQVSDLPVLETLAVELGATRIG